MSCVPQKIHQAVELFWCRSVLVWENCHFVGLLWVDADLQVPPGMVGTDVSYKRGHCWQSA